MSEKVVGAVSEVKKRIASLDLIRGLAIFLMISVNALFDYKAIPWWLKHAPWDGYTISDIVAPMFLFSIGVAYNLSFKKRRSSHGTGKTVLHFIIRYVILFSFGFFGEWVVLGKIGWGVLTMIGTVGIYCLVFMFLSPTLRVIISAVPFIAYQVLLSLNVPIILFVDGGLGGPAAIPAWGFIVILASAAGNWIYKKDYKRVASVLGIWGAALTAFGVILSFIISFNKHLVSASYVLFSSGISLLAMLLFYLLADIWRWKIPILGIIGRNALVLYILSALFILGFNALVPIEAKLLYVILGTAAVLGICIGVGVLLDWKKWYVRL
ncbi:DUF1624 domain-containing protein [candidate division WOR-3 bacterium]|nr:DUF1624 domain-containing protein [candidate division WOR-3 bacterium]